MDNKSFPPLKNDLVLRAARGERTERVPVWVMRQAGRYLPEYQELSKKYGFFEKCQTPELACEVTLQPLRRYDLDASIIFSDILVIPQALGLHITMEPSKGPVVHNPLVTPEDLERLRADVDVKEELKYVMDAITLTRHRINGQCPLFGFSGAPFALMYYMIDKNGANDGRQARSWFYKYPAATHRLLQLLTRVIIEYLIAQVDAGAQLLQVFESHGGFLTRQLFREFALPCLLQIAADVKAAQRARGHEPVPMVIFVKDGHYCLADIADIGYDVVQIDSCLDPKKARSIVGPNKSLQGNLDPCALHAPKAEIQRLVREMVGEFGTQRYIANLGHGIHLETDPDQLKVFIDAVHSVSEEINQQ